MPDHQKKGKRPTKREREVVFAPHESPHRQADGDPGRKPRPRLEPEPELETDKPAEEAAGGATSSARGQRDTKR